jgi:hypothetical protein
LFSSSLDRLKLYICLLSNGLIFRGRCNSNEILTKENLKRMKDLGEKFKGKNYDIYFEWTDDKIYCSELVWKIYKEALDIEIGELQELREFDLSNDIVKNKMKEIDE